MYLTSKIYKKKFNQMKKTSKIISTIALFLCTSFLTVNELKAQNNSPQQSSIGTIISLNAGLSTSLISGANQAPSPGLKTGLIMDETTGEVFEFKYAGLEVLEINGRYTYILQITASGKVIIRDVRHSPTSLGF